MLVENNRPLLFWIIVDRISFSIGKTVAVDVEYSIVVTVACLIDELL